MIRIILTWFKQNWIQLTLLTLAVGMVYFNSLPNAFISDDLAIATSTPTASIASALNTPSVLTRALLYLGIYKLAGLSPWAYRLANIVFHIFNVLLIYELVRMLSKKHIAFLSAMIFAVHPMMVESVTWISGGVYPQYSFFILLALISYILARRQWSPALFIFSIAMSLLAFTTSDKAVVLPLLIALYEFSFGSILRSWKKLLPFFFIDIVFIGINAYQINTRIAVLQTTFFQNSNPVRNPLIYIPEAITGYLKLFFWPIPLSLYHPTQLFSIATILINSAIAGIFISIMIVAYYRTRLLFFFLAFFLISLSPTLLPLQLSWTVAERYAYLGMIGLTGGFAYLISQLPTPKNSIYVFILPLIAVLSFRSIIRNTDWNNEITFWSATAKTTPNLPNVHHNLAVALGKSKQYDKAIYHFQQAVNLKPDWIDAYFNLAFTYQQSGKFPPAIINYNKALELNPKLWQAYRNLGEISFGESKYDEAIAYLHKAIEISPTNANLYTNLALVYQKTGNSNKARQALDRAIQIDPANPYAKELLGPAPIDNR